MIYIVYWLNDYKRALDSLCKHAVCGKVRYVPCNKPYLLPDVIKRFDLGLNGNLLAVCVSEVAYNTYSWRSRFGPDMKIELVSFGTDKNEAEFMEWFDYHISPFRVNVRGGVVRHLVRPESERVRARTDMHDGMIVADFVADMRATFQKDADDLMNLCLKEVGTQYGNVLADKQDEFLIMNKKMMIRWTKLEYHRVRGQLTDIGRRSLAMINDRITQFIDDYIAFFYRTENEWSSRFTSLFYARRVEFARANELEPEFLVPSKKIQLSTFREWLQVEYPKERPGYFVLPIWFNEELVRKTLLARVMPWEQHLRNLATMSPAPRPKIVHPPSYH